MPPIVLSGRLPLQCVTDVLNHLCYRCPEPAPRLLALTSHFSPFTAHLSLLGCGRNRSKLIAFPLERRTENYRLFARNGLACRNPRSLVLLGRTTSFHD